MYSKSSFFAMTDCCGSESLDDAETCPDCGFICCDGCTCSGSRGWCRCRYGLRGYAHSDQRDEDGRAFVRFHSPTGYSGPFKPVLQAQMEADMMRLSQARVQECGYAFCGADTRGVKDPATDDKVLAQISRTKLTNDNVDHFVVCERCRSVAYCSEQCRALDRVHRHRNPWDGFVGTHADQCDADCKNLDNATLPYVGFEVREYRKKFGYYPNPLGKKEEGK